MIAYYERNMSNPLNRICHYIFAKYVFASRTVSLNCSIVLDLLIYSLLLRKLQEENPVRLKSGDLSGQVISPM